MAKTLPGTDAYFDRLIEMVASTIHPTSWDEVGGPGTIQYYMVGSEEVLVISQTCAVHREIRRLFADLRAVKVTEAKKMLQESTSAK